MKKGGVAAKRKEHEKREYYRLPYEFKVSFKPLEFPLGEHRKKSSKIKDVSGGGLLFESDDMYEIGTVLQLELEIEGWYRHRSSFFKSTKEKVSEPLTVIGEVIRVERFDDNTYDIGVKFTNVYDDDHNSLIKYINSKKK
jgi:hypothetical protein